MSESVSQSINQPTNQSNVNNRRPQQSFIQTHRAMQPRSVDLSHPTTPTRTVCHSTGNSFNLIQPIVSRHVHSLTQHVTFTPFSGFLSLMPLSLAWFHPHILSVRCALRSRAISRLLSHAAPHLAHSHAHAHAKTEMSALPLSLAHLRLPRTNRTDREVHDLWIRRGVEPADHKGEHTRANHPHADAVTSSDCLMLPLMLYQVSSRSQS